MSNIILDTNIAQKALESALIRESKVKINFYQELRYFLKKSLLETLIKYEVNIDTKKEINTFKINVDSQNNLLNFVEVNQLPNLEIKNLLFPAIEIDNLFYIELNRFPKESWYTDNTLYHQLPCLASFQRFEKHSIGSFAFSIKPNQMINITDFGDLKAAGYSFYQTPKGKQLIFYLLAVYFENDVLQPYFSQYLNSCNCNACDLDEISILRFPQLFICRKCGKIYTCKCFADYFDFEQDIINKPNPSLSGKFKNYIKEIGLNIRDNICHLCTKEQPKCTYWGYEQVSAFLGKGFAAYHELLLRKNYRLSTSPGVGIPGDIYVDCENTLRQQFGYPLKGEGKLVSETKLFKLVQEIFPDKKILRHYRGYELNRLELDIFIPELKLGIEYQGKQHYQPVKQFGGKKSLNQQQIRDKKKKELCRKSGYDLIEFKYDEELSIEIVKTKLFKYLQHFYSNPI